MKKYNKLFFIIACIGAISGTLVKLNGEKNLGNLLLGLSTLFWLIVIIPLIYNFTTRNLK